MTTSQIFAKLEKLLLQQGFAPCSPTWTYEEMVDGKFRGLITAPNGYIGEGFRPEVGELICEMHNALPEILGMKRDRWGNPVGDRSQSPR